ncbi:MAG: lipocalin-like domain-containing protein [Methylococcales bacterium]
MKSWLALIIGVALLLFWLLQQSPPQQSTETLDLNSILSSQSSESQRFSKADRPRIFRFPEDHAAHPGYRIEWWYLTGNLKTKTNKTDNDAEYGYQITFFRTTLQAKTTDRKSAWASNHIWMAHLAVSDINQQQHYQQQRLSRESLGLAGFQQQPFKIWLEDWQITAADNGDFPWKITAKDQQFSIDLTVNPLKPAVLQGDEGFSQKSAEAGNASYYYSFSRLNTTGTLTIAGKKQAVEGLSWLDREWSSSTLGKNQVGWDWFSLQLNNGEELMFYRLRNKTGQNNCYSHGKWIKSNSNTIDLTNDDVKLTELEYWQSDTGRTYPISWQLTIPKLSQKLIVKAAIKDQLMRTSINYWEGAVTVHAANSQQLIGKGYLEMTGY